MSAWDGLNRRKFPRLNYPCQVIVRSEHEQRDSLLAHTENLGTGGICVIIKKNLKMFTPVDIELDLLDFEEHIQCQGKVVWSVRRRDDDAMKPLFYDVGIEFVDLADKDLQRIEKSVQHLVKGGKNSPRA
jgi:Tfp pilus assembly protein PilZ